MIRDPAQTRERLLAVAGDKYSYRELDEFTDLMKRTFQTVDQVSKVDRSGVLDEQVTLSFSQERRGVVRRRRWASCRTSSGPGTPR